MKAFSFKTADGTLQIGLEYEGSNYNFSQAWEFYKKVHNRGKGPSLSFLQVMVEADFFSADSFNSVLMSLNDAGALAKLILKEPIHYEPPIGRPQKILCIGRNYKAHAKELGNEVPDEPLFFSKAPSALLAHEGVIRISPGVGRVDFEGELAVVIGSTAKNVTQASAMDYVAGFSIMNDVTARELQRSDIEAAKPWFRSKSFDTFCPFGPYLVPKDAVKDYTKLRLEVKLNGERKQYAALSDMIFEVSEIIAYLSKHCTLEPGDVIATGTPSGVTAISSGDIVECEITGLGKLRNRVE